MIFSLSSKVLKNSHSLLHGLLVRPWWPFCWLPEGTAWVEIPRCPLSLVPAAWLLVSPWGCT